MKNRIISLLALLFLAVSIVCPASAEGRYAYSAEEVTALARLDSPRVFEVKLVPVRVNGGGTAGLAVRLQVLSDEGAEFHYLLQWDRQFRLVSASTSQTYPVGPVYWDPWDYPGVNLITDVWYQFKYDSGTSNSFVRPDKVGVKVVSGNTGNISYIALGYWINGAKYSYPSCLSEASPVPVATGSHLSVGHNYNNPVVGVKSAGGSLSSSYAISYSGASGTLRMGAVLTNGTHTPVYTTPAPFLFY